jgi:metallo-beta-lactamase family protein
VSARPPSLQFLGGAGTVTGSKFLLRTGTSQILVDCGLFQGLRDLRRRNWDPLPVDAAAIDAVVLTHAHVDHCGYLPRLAAEGFRGPVYATPSTAALARIVLPDCAHLQEEEAEYANRKGFSKHDPALPLYTREDAARALDLLQTVPFHDEREVVPGVGVRFSPAGHILGAASLRLMLDPSGTTVGFSGDLGRQRHPFLVAPDPPGVVDTLLVESTYGDRRHAVGDGGDELAAAINRTIARGGSVLIPAFAVDRTEVVLYHLDRLAAAGRIPGDLPIYVDSPMALSAMTVYRDAIARRDPDIRPDAADLGFLSSHAIGEVRDVEGSKALNHPQRPSIVVSASGMATGGRVVHHLAHWLPDARHTVVLVGYQASGTRGRQLLDGVGELKMLGRYVRVRADVVGLDQYSVHADAPELLQWVTSASTPPTTVYVVHGEPSSGRALSRSIGDALGVVAVVPRLGERVRLDRPS